MTLKKASIILLSILIYGLIILLVYLWINEAPEPLANTFLSDLETNQQKWQTQNISHYQFTLEVGCMCYAAGPLRIEVKNGKAVSIINKSGELVTIADNPNAGLGNIDFYAPFTTIDRMFAYAQNVVNDGKDFNAEYDAGLGFPTWMCFYNCGHLTHPKLMAIFHSE